LCEKWVAMEINRNFELGALFSRLVREWGSNVLFVGKEYRDNFPMGSRKCRLLKCSIT
jgi:hypothetical protein